MQVIKNMMVIKEDYLQWFTSSSNEPHRQIIRKSERRKFYSSLRDNIWGVDLAIIKQIQKRNQIFIVPNHLA